MAYLVFGAACSLAQTPKVVTPSGASPTSSTPVSATTDPVSTSGVSSFRGWNAIVSIAGANDSSAGWSSIIGPGISYRFNRFLSADASIPIFALVNTFNTAKTPKATQQPTTRNWEVGDTSMAGHLNLRAKRLDYSGTAAIAAPTGNSKYGLGAGQTTYDGTSHFETPLGIFTPDIEVGIGLSNGLVNRTVRDSFTTVGPLAHFQAGTSVYLPWGFGLESDAFEELPVGDQTVYTTVHRRKKTITKLVGTGVGEDNGFITELDAPLGAHTTLSGTWIHSLRLRYDNVAMSLIFSFRGHPRLASLPIQ